MAGDILPDESAELAFAGLSCRPIAKQADHQKENKVKHWIKHSIISPLSPSQRTSFVHHHNKFVFDASSAFRF